MLHPDPRWRWRYTQNSDPGCDFVLGEENSTLPHTNLKSHTQRDTPSSLLISHQLPIQDSSISVKHDIHDSKATCFSFSHVKFYLESNMYSDNWEFLLKCETQSQGNCCWHLKSKEPSPQVPGSVITSRHSDGQGPKGKFLPPSFIFLAENLMTEVSAFPVNRV